MPAVTTEADIAMAEISDKVEEYSQKKSTQETCVDFQ
jgi:hypothetical protein